MAVLTDCIHILGTHHDVGCPDCSRDKLVSANSSSFNPSVIITMVFVLQYAAIWVVTAAATTTLPHLASGSRLSPSQAETGAAAATTKRETTNAVNSTTCNGQFYAYTGLAGYGSISGNARDKYGDTIGGIGSAIALDQSSWTRSADGLTYQGLLWAMPDRGW